MPLTNKLLCLFVLTTAISVPLSMAQSGQSMNAQRAIIGLRTEPEAVASKMAQINAALTDADRWVGRRYRH